MIYANKSEMKAYFFVGINLSSWKLRFIIRPMRKMLALQLIPDRMNRNITLQNEESGRTKIPARHTIASLESYCTNTESEIHNC